MCVGIGGVQTFIVDTGPGDGDSVYADAAEAPKEARADDIVKCVMNPLTKFSAKKHAGRSSCPCGISTNPIGGMCVEHR